MYKATFEHFTQKDKRILIAALEAMLAGELEDPNAGICRNLYLATFGELSLPRLVTSMVAELSKSWPKFSGDLCYPVPSSSKLLTSGKYYEKQITTSSGKLWKGNQLHYRRSLIKHIISYIHKELAE